jgi:hypothetical protein
MPNTPPPAALNGSPKDDCEGETIPHPVPPTGQLYIERRKWHTRLVVTDGVLLFSFTENLAQTTTYSHGAGIQA